MNVSDSLDDLPGKDEEDYLSSKALGSHYASFDQFDGRLKFTANRDLFQVPEHVVNYERVDDSSDSSKDQEDSDVSAFQ